MITLDNVTTSEWIAQHEGLKVLHVACPCCGNKLSSTLPFISKGYVGLTTPPCQCGSTLAKAQSAIPRTAAERASWDEALGYR